MQRLTSSIKTLSVTTEAFYPTFTNLQIVRWGRKPRWLPTAKSKLFRVHPRKVLPEGELEEIRRLYNIFRTQVKSVKHYLNQKYSIENMEQFDIDNYKKSAEEDFQRCSQINDEWNREVMVHRTERIDKELEDAIAVAKTRLEHRLQVHAANLEYSEEVVKKQKELSKDFITVDKLDAAIEHAINNPVDYNFAIDLDGNKIYNKKDVAFKQ